MQQLRVFALTPLLAALVVGVVAGVQDARDPTISIRTAQPTAKPGILATFIVTNPGKKELDSVMLFALQKDGGPLRFQMEEISDNRIPDIEVAVGGGKNYDCLAILTFKEGKNTVRVASALKLNTFVNGAADKTDYGTLRNTPSVVGKKVEVATSFTAAMGWTVDAKTPLRTWLVPAGGGRFSIEDGKELIPSKAWITTRDDVAKGEYKLLGFLTVENDKKRKVGVTAKVIDIKVTGQVAEEEAAPTTLRGRRRGR